MGRISIEGLGKKYKRYSHRWKRLIEWGTGGKKLLHESLWALKGISFEVTPGESVGIVGQNGAGKSTLLKILTGTTQATEGSAEAEGNVSALLELGIGFYPEFTGRENVFMAGLLSGLSSSQITELLPSITSFSELSNFMDQPLRTYSSGMVVRLAFSIATAVRPDILIVDEALSVGDAYFQYKCIKLIREFREKGSTLLFVSHDPGAVKTLCNRAILLDKGLMVMDDTSDKVLDYYNAMIAKKNENQEIIQVENKHGQKSTRSGNFLARIEFIDILDAHGLTARAFQVGEEVQIKCQVRFDAVVESPSFGILIRDRLGNDVFGTNSFHVDNSDYHVEKGDLVEVVFKICLNIGIGNYSLTAAVHTHDTHLGKSFDWWDQALVFQVVPGKHYTFIGQAFLPVSLSIKKTKS